MRESDTYSIETCDNETYMDAVLDMEAHSKWITSVQHKSMELELLVPIEGKYLTYGLDYDLAMDTAKHTKLMLHYIDPFKGLQVGLLRDTAMEGLLSNVIGIGGSNIKNITTENLAACANTFIQDYQVKCKDVLLLERYGKISAAHSNADGGYAIMPIPKLLEITTESLSKRCGTVAFESGYVSHSATKAIWSLPDVQDEINKKYAHALDNAVSKNFSADLMPAVGFCSSDTSNAQATLMPMFLRRQTQFRFIEPAAVKHTKRGGKNAVDLFADNADGLFAMFDDVTTVMSELAAIEVVHGCNCFVSICNTYGINQKYGSPALEVIEHFCVGGRSISAFDLYMVLSSVPDIARNMGVKKSTLIRLYDDVAKAVNADWCYHDVAGTIAWNDEKKKLAN